MSEETIKNTELESVIEEEAVDVFTHSKTAFPGAWTEEEVSELLGTWREVVERTRPSARRFNVAQRILRRYRANGNNSVTIDVIRKQIKTLRTEYKVYQGLCKIGIKAHRAPCVDQLELILDKIPASRRSEAPPSGGPPAKGPLRRGARRTRAYSEGDTENRRAVDTEEETDTPSRQNGDIPSDQEASPKSRVRYQRFNMPRLVRVMVEQQQSVMERLERLFSVFETSNKRMLTLVDALVSLQQQQASGGWRAPTPTPTEEEPPLIIVQDADDN